MARKVTEIIERQMNIWSRQSSVKPTSKKESTVYPVITISREFGARGAAVAEYIGQKINFDVWDKELLKLISQELGGDQKLIETLDERRQQAVEDAVAAFISNIHTNVNYLHSLIRILRTIEEHGRGIIVGRGANYICEHPQSLHVRLVAPEKFRIESFASRHNMARGEVGKLVRQKDEEREEFIRRNFQKDVTNPHDYDLIINSEKFTVEQMGELVLQAYRHKTGKNPASVHHADPAATKTQAG